MQQIIKVDTFKRELYLYEDKKIVKNISNIVIGKNGITTDKREGDMCTPIGEYNLGISFGIHDLNITYPYLKINSNLYYIDDSSSQFYNKMVDVTTVKKDWQSAEHLIDYPSQYEYALVIEYNKNCIPNHGSAIFLHVATGSYTAGCIAVPKEEMLNILKWLNPQNSPIIQIR